MNQDSNRALWIVLAIVLVLGVTLCSAVVLIGVALTADGTSLNRLPSISFTPDVLFNLIFILLFALPLIFTVFALQKRIGNAGQMVQQKTGYSLFDIWRMLREQNFTNTDDALQFLKTRLNLSEEDLRAISASLSRRKRRAVDVYPEGESQNSSRSRILGWVFLFILIDLLIFGSIAAFWFLSR